jgi:hypothetical protein
MLGLSTPQTAALQIVEEAAPKESGIDKSECVLAELAAEGAKKNDPTTH